MSLSLYWGKGNQIQKQIRVKYSKYHNKVRQNVTGTQVTENWAIKK